MRSREHAELLPRKAAQDEFVVEKLSFDPASPDEVIGFHAQQSVEKTRKSALTLSSVHYGRTHSIAALIDLLAENGMAVPPELDQVLVLLPSRWRFVTTSYPHNRSNHLIARGLWIVFDRYERGPNPFCARKRMGRLHHGLR